MMWSDWLSDVRMLRANTRWSMPLCKRFVERLDRRYAVRDTLLYAVLPLAVIWVSMELLSELLRQAQPGPQETAALALLLAAPFLMLAVLGVGLWLRRRRLYRTLAAFRDAPWCLKCRYPVPPGSEDERTICPECGEPIAPEIATLAARRTAP